ncbi:SET domain-containing protein [Endothiovibrio diazotrophicus]
MTKNNSKLRDWIYVANSPIHGKGVFAKCPIPKGQYIGSYHGPAASRNGTYVLWVQETNGEWHGVSGRNQLRYLNHSNTPCAEFDGVHLYAACDIDTHEEITFNYGEDPAACHEDE